MWVCVCVCVCVWCVCVCGGVCIFAGGGVCVCMVGCVWCGLWCVCGGGVCVVCVCVVCVCVCGVCVVYGVCVCVCVVLLVGCVDVKCVWMPQRSNPHSSQQQASGSQEARLPSWNDPVVISPGRLLPGTANQEHCQLL